MEPRLKDRIALVTGGTRGIGEAIAARFAQEGATVIVVSRKPANVESAVERLRATTGGEVHGLPMHLGDAQAVAEVLQRIEAAHGPVDILVNNAATNPYFGAMVDIDAEAFDKTFEVNVRGTFLLTQGMTRRLIALDRPGAVITVSSIMGLRGAALQGVYGMTKAALVSMTQTFAIELGPARIRVNAIAPGLVETRFAAALTSSPEILAMFEGRTALGRIASPDEIAGTAAWLASDDASYVTGQTIVVDGGYTTR
jgi:NAD(P)-dependent dehydrogenase (short-subunit alcohol dehydrogenase family)